MPVASRWRAWAAFGGELFLGFISAVAFPVASSGNLPVILFALLWKRFNTFGAVAGCGGTSRGRLRVAFVGGAGMKEARPTAYISRGR